MATVSVIVPCYNHARFLPQAVRAILEQTFGDLELILVDDCSSDDSWAVIQAAVASDRRVVAIRHERNRGLSASRNDALKVATGEFVAFCDADDIWERDKLEFQLGLLRSHPGCDLVYCDTTIIDETGAPTGKRFSEIYPLPARTSGNLFVELLEKNFINIQSVLLRRRCLGTAARFEERFRVLEDWWFWLQLAPTHEFLYSHKLVAKYRVHPNTLNVRKKRSFPMTRVRIFRKLLESARPLSSRQRARVLFAMGADLCDLGRHGQGTRILCAALKGACLSGNVVLAVRCLRRLALGVRLPSQVA